MQRHCPTDKITIQQLAFLLSTSSVLKSTNAAVVPMEQFVGPMRELNQWNILDKNNYLR